MSSTDFHWNFRRLKLTTSNSTHRSIEPVKQWYELKFVLEFPTTKFCWMGKCFTNTISLKEFAKTIILKLTLWKLFQVVLPGAVIRQRSIITSNQYFAICQYLEEFKQSANSNSTPWLKQQKNQVRFQQLNNNFNYPCNRNDFSPQV